MKKIVFLPVFFTIFTNAAIAEIDINRPDCFEDKNCLRECLKVQSCNDRFIYETRKEVGKKLFYSANEKINNQSTEAFRDLKMLADSDLSYWVRTLSQYQIALMYKDGVGIEKNIEQAIQYFESSIANGKSDPIFFTSYYYKNAYLQLGLLYEKDSKYKNLNLSKKNLLFAARENCIFAQNNLAHDLLSGNGIKKNKKLSLALRFYELNNENNIRSWQFIEKNHSIETKKILENYAHNDIEQIIQSMKKTEIEAAQKLSTNEDQLFKLIEKTIGK